MQIVPLPLVHLDGNRLIRNLASHHLHEIRIDRDISQGRSSTGPGEIEILAEVAVHDLVVNQFAGRYGSTPAPPPGPPAPPRPAPARPSAATSAAAPPRDGMSDCVPSDDASGELRTSCSRLRPRLEFVLGTGARRSAARVPRNPHSLAHAPLPGGRRRRSHAAGFSIHSAPRSRILIPAP